MSRIKNKDTGPEMIVRRFLYSHGYRYRIHVHSLPGKPDIVLKKYKTVIFVHGCFWHGHENCKYFTLPKTRTKFWKKKIDRNKTRDKKNTNLLTIEGWNVIEIYECRLSSKNIDTTLAKLLIQIPLNHFDY